MACVCFVLTGEPDEEEERLGERRKLRESEKVTDVVERGEDKLPNSVAHGQRWMRSYS